MKKISESTWGDMRKRAEGVQTRREDDVNHMDFDTFAEYIKDTYSEKGNWFGIRESEDGKSRHIEIDIISGKEIDLTFNVVEGEIYNILVHGNKNYIDVPGLKQIFNVNIIGSNIFSVLEKNWTVSNSTFVKLIEFFLNKKSLTESTWGDMRKRAEGDDMRKENENFFKVIATYIQLYINKEMFAGRYMFGVMSEFMHFIRDYENNIRIETLEPDVDRVIKYCRKNWEELEEILADLYKNNHRNISVDEIMNMLKEKHILTESTWGDMRKRAEGVQTRMEDSVNFMEKEKFFDYLQSHYKVIIDCEAPGYGSAYIRFPLFVYPRTVRYVLFSTYSHQIMVRTPYIEVWPDNLLDIIKTKYKREDTIDRNRDRMTYISPKEGEGNNEFFLDFIDTILANVDKPALKKSLNESTWGDMRKRAEGEQVRKEDEYDVEDDDIKKYVKICVSHFVDYVVYQDRYDKSPETFLDCIKKGDRDIYGGLGLMHDRKHNQFVDPKEVLPKFIETHWETGECYKSYVNQSILDEEKKVRDTGFVKKPGESIFDTLYKWFEENASELGEDFADEVEEYNATYHSEGGSRYTDLGIEDWWDDLKYIEQIEIYQDYMKKTNESTWGDMRKRAEGEQIRKEDELTEEDQTNLNQMISDYGREVVLGWGRGGDACNLDEFIDYIEKERNINSKIINYVKVNWIDEICDLVDAAIEEVQEEYDVNESTWGDMRKRAEGEQFRKEDEVLSDMEINALNQFTLMYCRGERAHYIQNYTVPPPPSKRKENDYEGLIKYIENQRDENLFTNVGDYDKIIRFIKKNWDKLDMDKYIKERIFSPALMNGKKLVECEGVPGGATPADVGGMGPAYCPGPNGEPGSGDLPSPTGVVYHQVAPYTMFLKDLKKKKKKKKFRKEDEPCVHSPNAKVYDYVDDFREYVDRTYNNMDRK